MTLQDCQAALARALVAEQITREEFNAEMDRLQQDEHRHERTQIGGARGRHAEAWAGYPLTWGDEG